ncbi:preprotein translocase membrane subunit [Shewanella benthica]|uniref:Protein-export membrane protein SecG n=1 Tax=Shewanella benthica TaxID=43661 RepID=A0A330MDN1_9GAMM|nr:preprotein translocase subunit SecG [Shewanella benthica]SQH77897.1 preprotein translocase membrane subunit [Shewanella benthica]
MYEVLMVVYLLVAIGLVGLILIQQGKGADMGASFGAGASATLFGSSGAGNFLTRSTAVLAIGFFALSLIIGNLSANHTKSEDAWNDLSNDVVQVVDQVSEEVQQTEDKIPD